MIQGQVTAHKQAAVPLQLVDQSGLLVDLQAFVDTGFSGFLTLPLGLITVLQFPYDRSSRFTLGDNSEIEAHLYTGKLLWDGPEREVAVLAAEGTPLVGMSLLEGYRLFVDVIAGGEVRIEQRP